MGAPVSPHALPDIPASPDDGSGAGPAAASRPAEQPTSSEQERLGRLESIDADALRALVDSMPVIEQAKGIVMGCYGVDSAAAFEVLRQASSSGNLKVRVLAATVVQAASSPATSMPGSGPAPCQQVRRIIGSGPGGR
jgi:hypothetical protein